MLETMKACIWQHTCHMCVQVVCSMLAQVCAAQLCSWLKAWPAAAAAHLFLQHLVAWPLLLVLLHPCLQAYAALWLWQWVLHYLVEACCLQECCCTCVLVKHDYPCHLRWLHTQLASVPPQQVA